MTLSPFARGQFSAWDVTVTHTTAPSNLRISSISARAAASRSESLKSKKYFDLADHFDFWPFALESFGAFGPKALELVNLLSGRILQNSGDLSARSRVLRRLSAALQAGNANVILKSVAS